MNLRTLFVVSVPVAFLSGSATSWAVMRYVLPTPQPEVQAMPAPQTAPAPATPQVAVFVPRTVTWFMANHKERREKGTWCQDNPGLAARDVECPAVTTANSRLVVDNQLSQAQARGLLK
jgi:hypothetical protein